MQKWQVGWVALAMLIALAGVLIHVGAVIAGPSWFEFFHAPPFIQQSARDETWLAPLSALTIAVLMGLCGIYAASALGVVQRLPCLRPGLLVVALICLFRALLLPLLAVGHPELRNVFEVVSALIWGIAGIGFAVGWYAVKPAAATSLQ